MNNEINVQINLLINMKFCYSIKIKYKLLKYNTLHSNLNNTLTLQKRYRFNYFIRN